ncbi:MAG: hypothetical protein ABJN98_00065 [Roseibium sp.]
MGARNPFPGLRPFSSSERDVYFGRDRVAKRFVIYARTQPLTVLFGRSGTGKSSFLTCLIVPEAETVSPTGYLNEWGRASPVELISEERYSLLDAVKPEDVERPLLILDQFEDIFKFNYDLEEIWEFLAAMVEEDNHGVNLVLSMREEWLGAFDSAREYLPEFFDATMRLAAMSNREYRAAFQGPFRSQSEVKIDDEVVDTILQDLHAPSIYGYGPNYIELGLLQITAARLWDAAAKETGRVTLDLYESLGRASGIVGSFVWDKLDKVEKSGEFAKTQRFTVSERMLWVAFTRHLIAAPGVKSVLTPTSLARNLSLVDFGASGEAAVSGLGGGARSYIYKPPETRDPPPPNLVKHVRKVLEKARELGFLKRHQGHTNLKGEYQEQIYELSHDGLASLLTLFAVEYDKWLNRRKAILAGILVGGLMVLPMLIVGIMTLPFAEFMSLIGAGALGLVVYGAIIWISAVIFRLIRDAIVRTLARGRVPRPSMTRLNEYLTVSKDRNENSE